MNRTELQLHDPTSDTDYFFTIVPNQDGRGKAIQITSKDWEPADGTLPWRVALHPWAAGIGPDRIEPHITFTGDLKNRPAMVYAKSNADASNPHYLTFPPATNALGSLVTTNYYNTATQLRYDGSYYGGTTYMGAGSNTSGLFRAVRNFNGKAYFAGGQYLYSLDASYNYVVVKDFGAGKTIADIEPFNNELIIAMGETEKIWKMTTGEAFTQATDATYAIALGTTDNKLWRAASVNLISNCITAPLTLTSWVPSAGNEYTAGDTTYSVTDLIEYGGVIAAVKPEGVFFPDSTTVFRNQTPQLATYPDSQNGLGAFVAWGYLWVPSIVGLLRVTVGESLPVGPELSNRPDFRFHVRAGVEWNSHIYLLCTDEASTAQTFVCKMMRNVAGLDITTPYIYHEWCRLGGVLKGYILIVYTTPTNPTMVAGYGTGAQYMLLGRGSGLDVDDTNYVFGTSMELESGELIATTDLGIEIDLVGIKLVGQQIAGATLTASFDMDNTGSYTSMENRQDEDGHVPVTESGMFSVNRYAPPNTVGNIVKVKLTGTLPTGTTGASKTKLREAWLYGGAHPDTTDVITLTVYADRGARVSGLRQGRSSGDVAEFFLHWAQTGKVLVATIPEYALGDKAYVVIIDAKYANTEVMQDGRQQVQSGTLQVTMRRVDFAGLLNG